MTNERPAASSASRALSIDWISLFVALGLAALARAGVLGAIPW